MIGYCYLLINKSHDYYSYDQFNDHFFRFSKIAAGGENKLTDAHIVRLAACISTRDLESVAVGYLDIGAETIKSLRDQHRENLEALNRDILQKWAYKNPGSHQVKVIHLIIYKKIS